ncbi:helix-hairpin-helix domain-containing protein [Glycomyces tarimensis]
MTTRAQLRKSALSHPGVSESGPVFTVSGEEFASLDANAHVRLRLPPAESEDMASQHATAERAGDFVRLPIEDINGQALNYWVRRAWLACAPPELAAKASTAEQAGAGEVGDLPKGIGRPATRALANAGITTLDQVARLSDADLKALHGVGPKAVRMLREALDAR